MLQIVLAFLCYSVIAVLLLMMPIDGLLLKCLYLINAAISTASLFSYPKQPYSLHKLVNLFILFFFVLANALQCSEKSIVTSIPIRFDQYDYLNFQIWTLIILLLYNLFYAHLKPKMKFKNYVEKQYDISCFLLIIISVISTLLVFAYYRNGLMLMFFRGVVEDEMVEDIGVETDEGTLSLMIFGKIIRVLPFACYILALNYKLNTKVRIFLLVLMTLAVFPLGIARNAAAMYWIPVILFHFKIVEKTNYFIFGMMIALLIIFPLLDSFRRWTGEIYFLGSLGYLNTMNFDSSQEFMVVIKHNTITYGYQLLGAFVFWLPRSIWMAKPIGSGAYIADEYGAFGNISMPFFAEGYINFGYPGVIIFTLFLSWITIMFDKAYWKRINFLFFRPYYLVIIGSIFYILRGDLLSSFSYTLATLFDIYVVYLISRRRFCKINKNKI